MDIVLGVSMTPSVVRMALVEGKGADGVTLDQDAFDVVSGVSAATSDAPEQVVAAILGTRESAAEGAHHLAAVGVAWTDHAAAARLRQALRAQQIDDVILVSELHAASALAQALGRAVECERTALLFVERDSATLAVVQTSDAAVLKVASGILQGADEMNELRDMLAGLETGVEPPQTLFVVGSGVDTADLKERVTALTSLPVHAPDDGDLALARGAALAAANTPLYEASTVGLFSTDDTAAGPTQMAAAGYMAPLGYSAVGDDDLDLLDEPGNDAVADEESGAADNRPFVLLGSVLSTVFVVGVVALVISLAVAIRPTVDQRPIPGGSAVVSNNQPAPPQAQEPAPPAAPETIQAPIPVVQEAPRTVFVTPREALPAPAPAAPAPEVVPAPAPALAAPAPVPEAPAPAPAPAPAAAPPVVVPVPIIAPILPPIFQIPARTSPRFPRGNPATPSTPAVPSIPATVQAPSTAPAPAPTTQVPQAPSPSQAAPTTAYPTYTAPVTTVAPSSDGGRSGGGSNGSSRGSQTIWPPLWPFGG